jgi:uncharacterized membrane protein
MNDTSQEFADILAEAIAQIQRAKLNEAAMNGELPSIIETLVDDE